MALAIADAQVNLDESSMEVAELMSGQVMNVDDNGIPTDIGGTPLPNPETDEPTYTDTRVYFGYTMDGTTKVPSRVSMMELGFTPTFYQFVDTIIEVKIAIKITRESEYTQTTSATNSTKRRKGLLFKRNRTVQTSQVDATYSSRYGYTAEGSSLLRTKLVPVPPPAILEERIRAIMELERNPPTP
ncbi:MAG: hypothetical protein AB1Z98_14855 [Nannocystaceae bacterium]